MQLYQIATPIVSSGESIQRRRVLASDNHRAKFMAMRYPVTPDGRYFVVRGRLWRMSNPALSGDEREELVSKLMTARRAVATAQKSGDLKAIRAARTKVYATKKRLGERGPVWWDDGAPDVNRHMARNTSYADWFASLDNG